MGRTKDSGQGSIYKRGDKWRGQITINGERRSFTSKKKKDVVDWIAKLKTDENLGLVPRKSNITIKELTDECKEICKETGGSISFTSDVNEGVKNADVIWIQSNCLSHSQFGNIMRHAGTYNKQVRYFTQGGWVRCAQQMVEEDKL